MRCPTSHPFVSARGTEGVGRRQGFTLVELIVAIGIIAVLLAILLPSLNRVRESARRVQCLSNLKQLGIACLMYTNANHGTFPYCAPYSDVRADDWIYWESSQGRDLNHSTIVPYLSQPVDPVYFRCPSDVVATRIRTNFFNGYRYSYVMNSFLRTSVRDNNDQLQMYSLRQVPTPADKVLFYEEDENTIDDGYGTPNPGSHINLLAIRHDSERKMPDNNTTGLTLNGQRRGNAAFCDGHAEYVPRNELHTPHDYDPQAR